VLTVGIITGLQSEADCLRTISRDLNLNILVSGVSPDRAEALARRLCENQCDLLLSFGIAGALRAGIATGDLLIPASVIQSDGRVHETNAEIRARLLQRARAELPEFHDGIAQLIVESTSEIITLIQHPDTEVYLK